MKRPALFALLLALSCAHEQPKPPPAPEAPAVPSLGRNRAPLELPPLPGEAHFGALRQLTFGGENAEAYWSGSGKELTMQSRLEGWCADRILRIDAQTGERTQVSSGEGATTCAYFLPGDEEVIYASTHKASRDCPPKPDMSQGYVWALYDSYDIYRANKDGSNLRPLTTEKGYDAEATVCSKDGSIVFTSTRDGDLELYRMDKDGKNVKRLTSTPGYDGGAFFNHDCSKLVWRASRPKPGKELQDYQRLLAQGLVRPSKLELYVANADGSDATQITYLNAASFAPFWHPKKNRILFSTNFQDPKGREFDIWAVDSTGANLERITTAPGFDGFPMFSPDGSKLAFSSNRATAPGSRDTNLFIADWKDDGEGERVPTAADQVMKDVGYLAHPDREGRGLGSKGLEAAAAFIERRFQELGLTPAGEGNSFRQSFPVVTELKVAKGTALQLGKASARADGFRPLGFSAEGDARGEVVFAGYGIQAAEEKQSADAGVPAALPAHDDYAGKNVKGKIVLVRRFTPEGGRFAKVEEQRRYGDIRHKAFTAKQLGAKALIVVDWPEVNAGAEGGESGHGAMHAEDGGTSPHGGTSTHGAMHGASPHAAAHGAASPQGAMHGAADAGTSPRGVMHGATSPHAAMHGGASPHAAVHGATSPHGAMHGAADAGTSAHGAMHGASSPHAAMHGDAGAADPHAAAPGATDGGTPHPSTAAMPQEARLPSLKPEGAQHAGIPVVVIKRAGFEAVIEQLVAGKKVQGRVKVAFDRVTSKAHNVIAKLPASSPEARQLPKGAVVIGAHYDHLGFGGPSSLAPDSHEPHVGADDNASGVSGVLEAARQLLGMRGRLPRDIYFVAFAGEETGLLGSTEFTRAPPLGLTTKDIVAMINLDMVGRLRENRIAILGGNTAAEWPELIEGACEEHRVDCTGTGDGYGPSDQTPFFAAGSPVLHFFTGAHGDYHKPSDVPEKLNAAGVVQLAGVVAHLAGAVARRDAGLTFRNVPAPAPQGDLRSFNASLGTVPDYAPPKGTRGVLLAGVRPGGGADLGGLRRGDQLIRLGAFDIGSVEDLMYALNASKPGETVTAVVLREGKEVKLQVTFQESKRR